MICQCSKRVQTKLEKLRRDAVDNEKRYVQRIETFQEGIKSGAEEIAVRHLYRAGVYWASADNGFTRSPSQEMILQALLSHIQREVPDLSSFLLAKRTNITDQGAIYEPEDLLRRIVRNKSKAPSLLQINTKNEIEDCKRALQNVIRVRERMNVWKEGIKMRNIPEAVCIIDIHN